MKLSEGEADDITSVSKSAESLSVTISMPVASCSDKFNYKPKADIIAEQQQINPKLKNPFKKHLR